MVTTVTAYCYATSTGHRERHLQQGELNSYKRGKPMRSSAVT